MLIRLRKRVNSQIKDRNKHIRITDGSLEGGEIVNQYVSYPIVSASEDESKIYEAENRVIKKREMSRRTVKDTRKYGKSKSLSKSVLNLPCPWCFVSCNIF